MNIISKMAEVEVSFKNIQDAIAKKTEEYNKEMAMFTDELKMLQGEYRLLSEMGKETGILDPTTGLPFPVIEPEAPREQFEEVSKEELKEV
jgi:hypothetical protein